MSDEPVLQIRGLHGIELDELTELVPPSAVRDVVKPERRRGEHGELTLLTATLFASGTVVQALSAWLARRAARKRTREGFTITVEPGGAVRIELADLAVPGGSEPSSTAAEIMAAIGEALKAAT